MSETETEIKPPYFSKDEFGILKLYLSTMTARRASSLYYGIIESKTDYILSNLEPEDLIKYCDSSFSIHILSVKDETINRTLKKLISWLDITDTPYLIKIANIISALNKTKGSIDEIPLIKDPNGIVYVESEEKKTVFASPIHLFQATKYLFDLYGIYSKYKLDDVKIDPKFILKDIDKDKLSDGIITTEVIVADYGISSDKYKKFDVPLVDGIETISFKEFITKQKDLVHEFKLCTWLDGGCITYCSVYSDKSIDLISVRPNVRIYVNPKKKDKQNV